MQHLHMFLTVALLISAVANFILYILRKRCEEGSEEYARIAKKEKLVSAILSILAAINFFLHHIYDALYKI